jgi:hypothetical protein
VEIQNDPLPKDAKDGAPGSKTATMVMFEFEFQGHQTWLRKDKKVTEASDDREPAQALFLCGKPSFPADLVHSA